MEKENTGINVRLLLPPLDKPRVVIDKRKNREQSRGKQDAHHGGERSSTDTGPKSSRVARSAGLGNETAGSCNAIGLANEAEAVTRLTEPNAINHHGGKMNDYEEIILFLADLAEEYAAEADLEELDFQEAA